MLTWPGRAVYAGKCPAPVSEMKKITRYLGLAARILIFLVVLGFALKNDQAVTFHAYLGADWQAPLIVMLGLAFALGALAGVLALLPKLFRLRRALARVKPVAEDDPDDPATHLPVV